MNSGMSDCGLERASCSEMLAADGRVSWMFGFLDGDFAGDQAVVVVVVVVDGGWVLFAAAVFGVWELFCRFLGLGFFF